MSQLLAYALTTVADVKESMGIASSDISWDNLIIRKINQVTKQIEAYCQRRFLSTVYTDEEYSGSLIDQMVLNQRPITAFTGFSVRDSSLNDANFESIESELYFVDMNSGMLNLLFKAPGHWNRYRVSYTAGYPTIPEDLAEAAASLAAYYTLNADSSTIGVQDKQEGQRRVRYTNIPKSFSEIMNELGINTIIDSYANYPLVADR